MGSTTMTSTKTVLTSENADCAQTNLVETVEGKIAALENFIQKVTSRRGSLHENADSVKSSIREWITLQLDNLRQREVQLFRQVDALVIHQNLLLQEQLTKLYYALGSLRAMKLWLLKEEVKFPIDLEGYDECLQNLPVKNLKFYVENGESLQSAIHTFGCVTAEGGISGMFSLPKEEDYGDGDHHVLYKALQDEETAKVYVNFPTLSQRKEDWLQHRDLKVNKLQFSDIEMVDCPSFSSSKTSIISPSESIEVISLSESTNTQRPNKEQGQEEVKSNCNFCQSSPDVEIENLDNLSCASSILSPDFHKKQSLTSQWLKHADESIHDINTVSTSMASAIDGEYKLYVPSIHNTCKSNEMCKTYSECCYEESCVVTSLKEQLNEMKIAEPPKQHTLKQAINKAIQKQSLLQDGLEKWLTSQRQVKSLTSSVDLQTWLSSFGENSSTSAYQKPEIILPEIFSIPDTNIWLSGRTGLVNNTPVSENKSYKGGSGNLTTKVWLSHFQNQMSVNTNCMKQMFKPYFQPLDKFRWLQDKKTNIKAYNI